MAAWQAVAQQITAEHDALDILVNNAAILRADNRVRNARAVPTGHGGELRVGVFGHTTLPAADVSPGAVIIVSVRPPLRGYPVRCLHCLQGGGAEFDDEHRGVSLQQV